MSKRYYTLDDLYVFCKQNNFSHFSSEEAGAPIIVQSFGRFEAGDSTTQGLIPVTLQACHTELNRNNSYISNEVMEKALSSFANRPILGYIHQLDDGTYDFYTHNIRIIEDENSKDGCRFEYDERPIGVIPESCNAHLQYDEDKKKNYVVVTGYVYEDYGNRAVDIIKNNGGSTKVSVEIAVNEMSYNAKENYLSIDDMCFMGVTCLGKTPDGDVVQEGMEGSNLKLDNFSAEKNGMVFENYSDKLVDLLSEINDKLDNISNTNFNKKGVKYSMSHFEELLEQYGVTVEDVDFEYESMSDDELDAVFEEHFKCKKKHEEVNSDVEEHDVSFDGEGGEAETTPSETNPDSEEEDEEEVEEEVADDTIGTVRIKTDDFSKTFSVNISHGEILCALYNLIAQYDESDNDYYFIRDVYDAYFLMQGWCTGKIYKQSYVVEDENVALSGERQEMFEIILTESEKLAIEKMRENYAELVEFKEKYDLDVARSAKQSALNADDYSDIAGTEAFENLVKNIDSYSVEELCEKADRMLGEFYKQNKKNFNFDVGSADKQRSVSINLNAKPSKKRKAYAGLFDE